MAVRPLAFSGGTYDDATGALSLILTFTENPPSAPAPPGVTGFQPVAPEITFTVTATKKLTPGPWQATYRQISDGSLWRATYDATSGTWSNPQPIPEPA